MEARWRPAPGGVPGSGDETSEGGERRRGMVASREAGRRLDDGLSVEAGWSRGMDGNLAFLPRVPSRRGGWALGAAGVDLRRTARRWAERGGRGLGIVPRPRYVRPGRLVVLWDVSGSMSSYVPLYLPWMHRLVQVHPGAGVFPFGTHLVDATAALRRPVALAMLELAGLEGPWSGGTSIGEMLHQWIDTYGPRWLRAGTTVVVVSDGWDSGPPERVADGLARMRARGAVVYWMNPLAATPGFEPRTRALRAALPHIHRLVAGESPRALLRFVRVGT
ncbi:VWA domain-containing protein [Alicyclobacillus sp.]|uniref:VWA domain-containing protein n=1 Tax=Alicyclobacillus sp. TaxID=61169 RepID=UPI0025C12153|nr:VWA domain-containing protein [Alicyclobacillus sp.]MCL6516859.1 VWA domain-containing protein [Alicyclobacillus sp.]